MNEERPWRYRTQKPRANCAYCGHAVDPDARSTWRRVQGWERKAQGETRRGGSDIVLRELVGGLACESCIAKRQAGVSEFQLELT